MNRSEKTETRERRNLSPTYPAFVPSGASSPSATRVDHPSRPGVRAAAANAADRHLDSEIRQSFSDRRPGSRQHADDAPSSAVASRRSSPERSRPPSRTLQQLAADYAVRDDPAADGPPVRRASASQQSASSAASSSRPGGGSVVVADAPHRYDRSKLHSALDRVISSGVSANGDGIGRAGLDRGADAGLAHPYPMARRSTPPPARR